MQFIETRGNDGQKPERVAFSDAILSPAASFGGLYVPESFPKLDADFLETYKDKSYKELAKALLTQFEIDIEEADLDDALARYDRYDNANNPVPIEKVDDALFVCELYHGPTRAFKDMALQPFGKILSTLAQKRKEHYLILAATSGDTGPAALSTFENAPYISVACLYPDGGTSDVQRLQMTTMEGDNLEVLGIKGNFDDAQNTLKRLLSSESFKANLETKNIKLSAANSVNFGRIIFQIIYHVHAYIELLRQCEIRNGEKIYLVVPSGNFGNALGGYYAMKMGLPIEKILIASNTNNILTELITTGKYDLNGKSLINTSSPAMDILKSSNVERILYDLFGSERTKELMDELERKNAYQLTPEELIVLRRTFDATFSHDDEVAEVIKHYADKGYIMDTHTATCVKCFHQNRDADFKTVIYSTAEWSKFAPTVLKAVDEKAGVLSDKEALENVSAQHNVTIPEVIQALFTKEEKHTKVIAKETIEEAVVAFLDRN